MKKHIWWLIAAGDYILWGLAWRYFTWAQGLRLRWNTKFWE